MYQISLYIILNLHILLNTIYIYLIHLTQLTPPFQGKTPSKGLWPQGTAPGLGDYLAMTKKPLVHIQKTMENHHVINGKSTISMGHFQ